MLSESGTDGRGGAALADSGADVVALLEPVRPAVMLEAVGADDRAHSPTEALVAPPLVSQGLGGDGADMSGNVPAHHARRAPLDGRCGVCYVARGRMRYRRQRLESGSGQWRRVCGVRRGVC